MTYTYSQARQNFAAVLDRASKEGKVLIRRRDGSVFMIQPVTDEASPLDVPGVNAGISAVDIVKAVRESRER